MKLTQNTDGTYVLDGTPAELAEFQKLNPPLIKVIGQPMPALPPLGPQVAPMPYNPFDPIRPYGGDGNWPWSPTIIWSAPDTNEFKLSS